MFSLDRSRTIDDNFSEREVIVSLKSNFLSVIGVDCRNCFKFSLLYKRILCVSHTGKIHINLFKEIISLAYFLIEAKHHTSYQYPPNCFFVAFYKYQKVLQYDWYPCTLQLWVRALCFSTLCLVHLMKYRNQDDQKPICCKRQASCCYLFPAWHGQWTFEVPMHPN